MAGAPGHPYDAEAKTFWQTFDMPNTDNAHPDRLLRKIGAAEPFSSLEDLLLVMAKNVEESLLEGGAKPGKDYGVLDLYKLAQPFALSVFESRNDVTFATSNF